MPFSNFCLSPACSDAKTVDDVVLGWSGFVSDKDSRIANTSRRGGRKKKRVKKETLDEKREGPRAYTFV